MSNVIDFFSRRETSTLNDKVVIVPLTRGEYLQVAKDNLSTDDYVYLLCAILDVDFYESAEERLRKVVDSYYTFKD
jgi:hypothetical protein